LKKLKEELPMPDLLKQSAVIFVFFILPGIVGARLAWTKGRNWLGWFLLNCCFPPTMMMVLFQGPLREVPGHYRQCPACREYLKWRETVCKYCRTDLPG
jgi:hypothetical protein